LAKIPGERAPWRRAGIIPLKDFGKFSGEVRFTIGRIFSVPCPETDLPESGVAERKVRSLRQQRVKRKLKALEGEGVDG